MVRRKAEAPPMKDVKRTKPSESFEQDEEGEASPDPYAFSQEPGDTVVMAEEDQPGPSNAQNGEERREGEEDANEQPAAKAPSQQEVEGVAEEIRAMETDEDDEEEPEKEIADLLDIVIPPRPTPVMNSDGSGARLLITKIVNTNFKSYYGTHVLGPFHQNFTSIVGPNGSGKSNVIDSLLFVFGFRAQRTRAKKVSVMIHNSEDHREVESCTVEIHFQKIIDKPDGSYDVVPNSQFYVSRDANRQNNSWYKINGKVVQFKEVAKKLRQQGIDLDHNRFLILQGEVEQIAMMKPKAQNEGDEGMLEYLEDIIGSSRLKDPIEKLDQKLEELQDMRTEKLARVKSAEKAKNDLEGPKNEAILFLELENKITRLQSKMTQYKMFLERGKTAELKAKLDADRAEYEEMKEQLKALEKQKKERNSALEALKTAYETASKLEDTLTKKMNELSAKDKGCRSDIKRFKDDKEKIENNIRNEEKKLQDAQEKPAKAEAQIARHREDIDRYQKQADEFEERKNAGMQQFAEESKELKEQREKHEKRRAELAKTVDDAQAKVDMAQQELDLFMQGEEKEKRTLNEYNAKLEQATNDLEARRRRNEAASRRKPQAQAMVEDLQQNQREKVQRDEELADLIRQKRAKAEDASAALRSQKARSAVVEALAKSNIEGVFGRLGDLGAIDEKYDVAISSTCGSLDNIVVDTIDTAQKCVEHLKRSGAGVATFIALDKQQRFIPMMTKREQYPENVPRMFDLIRVQDNRVLPAFFFALRDTLVADNLDQATRIAMGRQRRRVATLKGEVIEVHGTMTGGGNKVQRNRIGREVTASPGGGVTADRVNKMEKEVKELQEQQVAVRRDKRRIDEDLEKARRELQQIQDAIDGSDVDLAQLEEQVKIWENRVKVQDKKCKNTVTDNKAADKLRKTLDSRKEDHRKASAAAEEVADQVEQVQAEINEIEERLVGAANKSLEKVNRQLEEARRQITKEQAASKTADRLVKKSEAKILSLQQDHNRAVQQHTDTVEQIRLIEAEAEEVVDKSAEAKRMKTEAQEKYETAKNTKTDIDEKEQDLKSVMLDRRQQLNNQIEVHKNQEAKVKHLEDQWKKYKLHDLSDLRSPKKRMMRSPIRPPQLNLSEDGQRIEAVEQTPAASDSNDLSAMDSDEEGMELKKYEDDVLEKLDLEQCKYNLGVLTAKKSNTKPNMAAILEYRKKEKAYLERVKQLDAVTDQRNAHRAKFDELRKMRLNEFMLGFAEISTRLKEMYQTITIGGDAELELADSLDPFTEGIMFSVRPPKKSWKQISNLSGGEKTLSSLALVFALHHFKPTPLYVMDEIDAALDFRNVSIIANYIKERTKNAQFIIISLRNNMFELADRLVGIYKTHNCTKHVVIDPQSLTLGMPPEPQTVA